MRVLSLTHGPFVRSELFGDVVRAEGHELVEWDLPAQGLPADDGFEAVFVFGGEMNVGEELEHPWLNDEYELLRGSVANGTPLFGVCLGAQTLAHAHGGRVGPAPERLAGFYETTLTPAAAADPVFGILPERFDALNANGYAFELPDGAIELAHGPVPQGFRIGSRAWGVQFHPEVRLEQILHWWRDGRELPRPLAEVLQDVEAKLPRWQELGQRLCRAFLRVAAD